MANGGNPITETNESVENQGMMNNQICEEEVQEALGGMTCGKAVGVGEIHLEEWKYIGKLGSNYCADYLTVC